MAKTIQKERDFEMGKTFSNEVKQALQDIYYNERAGRGKEALALLEKASAAGDGDVFFSVFARIFNGVFFPVLAIW